MISSRLSGARQKNAVIERTADAPTNTAWLASQPDDVAGPGAVVLIGGASVIDFRIRVAQSHLRTDLLPSFWSQAGILVSRETFLTVPLDEQLAPVSVPSTNAVHECPFAAYDDPVRYPNVGVVNFAHPASGMAGNARRLAVQRSAVDLPQLVVAWLAFAWGAGTSGNPLLQGHGVPSAALVETAYGMGGIELTPGMASAASCPEGVWQAALWWHEYYEKTATADVGGAPRAARRRADPANPVSIVPSGAYLTRQPAAAVVEGPWGGFASPRPARERGAARARRKASTSTRSRRR